MWPQRCLICVPLLLVHVLILFYVSAYYYVCLQYYMLTHTPTCVRILLYVFPKCCICVRILLYVFCQNEGDQQQPDPTAYAVHVSAYKYICMYTQIYRQHAAYYPRSRYSYNTCIYSYKTHVCTRIRHIYTRITHMHILA